MLDRSHTWRSPCSPERLSSAAALTWERAKAIKAVSRLAGGKEDVSCRRTGEGGCRGFRCPLRGGTIHQADGDPGGPGDRRRIRFGHVDRRRWSSAARGGGSCADQSPPAYFWRQGGSQKVSRYPARRPSDVRTLRSAPRRSRPTIPWKWPCASKRSWRRRPARSKAKLIPKRARAPRSSRRAKGWIDASRRTRTSYRADTEAVQLQARLKSEWDSYWNGQEAAEAARAKLKAVTGATMSVAEHEVQLQARKDEHAAKAERAMKLEAEYRAARMESQAAYEMIGFAQALDDAKRTEVAYAGRQAAIDAAAGVPMPDDDKLAEADKAVAIAQAALECGSNPRGQAKARPRCRAPEGGWQVASGGIFPAGCCRRD